MLCYFIGLMSGYKATDGIVVCDAIIYAYTVETEKNK